MIGLKRMRAATPAGHCLACGDPLPPAPDPHHPGRHRHICKEPECKTAYARLYKRDVAARAERVLWFCGCCRPLRGTHAQHCMFARAKWPLVIVPFVPPAPTPEPDQRLCWCAGGAT